MSTLDVIFEDFYMCVSMIYKDKLQDNYSIFNEFLMKYTQIVSFKFQENGQRFSSERVKRCLYISLIKSPPIFLMLSCTQLIPKAPTIDLNCSLHSNGNLHVSFGLVPIECQTRLGTIGRCEFI